MDDLDLEGGTAWKISGPPENYLAGICRGFWALNDRHRRAWRKLSENDIVVFHSTAGSDYSSNAPSCVLGFARIGPRHYTKDGLWWPQEIETKQNIWPHVFSIDHICLASPNADRINLAKLFEEKSMAERRTEVAALLEGAPTVAAIQAAAQRLNPTLPDFPVNGSIGELRETYRRVVLAAPANGWAQLGANSSAGVLADELLSKEDVAALDGQTLADLLAQAAAYVPPGGPGHTQRNMRVRIESALQKYRVARLEDFTCQVCKYKEGYFGRSGIRRWIIQVDHIHGKADDGDERMVNLWVLCPRCHAEKTAGIIKIDRVTFRVTRRGAPISIRNNHLPIPA